MKPVSHPSRMFPCRRSKENPMTSLFFFAMNSFVLFFACPLSVVKKELLKMFFTFLSYFEMRFDVSSAMFSERSL